MASSIQSYRERTSSFKDLDLIAILILLESELERDRTALQLGPVFAEWHKALDGYGPGTIDLRLNDLLSSEEMRQAMLALLDAVDARLRAFDKTVPAWILNGRWSVPDVIFLDYSAAKLSVASSALREMLTL
jgi:hypothetical protein